MEIMYGAVADCCSSIGVNAGLHPPLVQSGNVARLNDIDWSRIFSKINI